MTAHIECDQPVVYGQARVHLATPLKPTLRGAMQEDNRTTLQISCLHDMQLDASAACDSMSLHRGPPV
jgi:hypothetical protein